MQRQTRSKKSNGSQNLLLEGGLDLELNLKKLKKQQKQKDIPAQAKKETEINEVPKSEVSQSQVSQLPQSQSDSTQTCTAADNKSNGEAVVTSTQETEKEVKCLTDEQIKENRRLFIEEFKKKNNLIKGKSKKERIEIYTNNHYDATASKVIHAQQSKSAKETEQEDENIPDEDTLSQRVGIENLGNTCFMNAALQCLSNLQPLADYFLQNKEDEEINLKNALGSGGLIVKAFSNLVREIHGTSDKSINPKEFLEVISHCNDMYSRRRQQDSQEFLLYLLDAIHEDLNRVNKKEAVETKEYFKAMNQIQLEKLAADSWGDYLKRNKSVIVDLFQGQLKSTLKCLKCHCTKYSFEPFMYLTLPIPEETDPDTQITIHNCLQLFLEKEILDGDEKWYCPECKEFQKSEKKIDLWKLPATLMICFKRFQCTSKIRRKVHTSIDFPLKRLDLREFIPKTLQKERPIYDLFSVISHQGSINFGHYTAYCKHSQDKQWFYFNDELTLHVSDPKDTISNTSAYMLFYSKSTLQLIKRQTLVENVNWPHKI